MFERVCPTCGKTLLYANKYNRNNAEKRNTKCKSCYQKVAFVGKNNPFYGKHHTEATKEKIRNRDFTNYKTKEFREKMSKVTSGKNNPCYGVSNHERWTKKYGKEEADRRMDEFKNKLSIRFSGKNNNMYGKDSPHGSGAGIGGWYNGWFFRSLRELTYVVNVLEKNNDYWKSADNNEYKVKYVDEKGSERTYRPDFIVNDKIIIEIKPGKLQKTVNNKLKFKAAKKFYKKLKIEYKVIDIVPMEKKQLLSLIEEKKVKLTDKWAEKILHYE